MRWIIGDIHGMLRPLQSLVSTISRRDPTPHLIFVGDYVNRGPDSKRVIDLLLSLPRATFLRGNHDDVFDLLLHGDSYITHPGVRDSVAAFTWFMEHGLAETLVSYGVDWADLEAAMQDPTPERINEFLKLVPASHRRFVHSLKAVYETDTFFVAHGFWHPDLSDGPPAIAQRLAVDPNLRYQLLWGRFTYAQVRTPTEWRRTGYFGHTPVPNYPGGDNLYPVTGPNIVMLDTASALLPNGMLSAVCAEAGNVLQADREGGIRELPQL